MYLPAVYAEQHLPTLRAFIRANPLGTLTTAIDAPTFPFIQSSHIPWVLDADDDDDDVRGVLRGHMARANPQAKAMIEHLKLQDNGITQAGQPQTLSSDVLVLFNGPAHYYVTPKFYVDTKPTTAKVVPTWNYVAVQIYGQATVYFDTKSPATDAFLSKQISDLSIAGETQVMGYQEERAWKVTDAPEKYINVMKKAIIGIEIQITRMEGKWKMSQEAPLGDREGVITGYESLGSEVATEMARTVKERGVIADRKKEGRKEARARVGS